MRSVKFSITAALLAMLAVTGCSNTRNENAVVSTLKSILKRPTSAGIPDAQQLAKTISLAMQSSDGPLALIVLENAKTFAVLRQIETNGTYRTWATLGSSERRSITTKNGFVTATRGLGGDLMSANADSLLSLVRNRREGQASNTQRFLDGEYQTVAQTATCTLSRGGVTKVVAGEINQNATQVTARCQIAGQEYTNMYMVSSSGRVLQTRQWIGPTIGYATIQQLR